jgi:excisionase family DNA binding protein
MTVDEACEQLGIAKTKLYELMRTGELASVKLPPATEQSGRRIEQAEIERFIDRNRVQA